jgi:class 3 adenylate cyclase
MERSRSENLLLNILPPPIVTRLKSGESIIADGFPEATVLFADVVGFTKFSADMVPVELVTLLNELFELFDSAADKNGVEKIKTMGDAYIAVCGVPIPRPDHIEATVNMALDVRDGLNELGNYLRIRTGIHTGPVVAGVIGTKKFIYDLWGDTVNVASRMQSTCEPSEIQVSAEIYDRVCNRYKFVERGFTLVKGKGEMRTYLLIGRK